MARKPTRVSRRMLFTWFMLAGFILLFSPQNITGKFQLAFARIFSLPLSLGRSITLATRTSAPADGVSRQQYDQLASEHNRLNNHLYNVIQQRDQEHEKVAKISALASVPDWKRMAFILADIVTPASDRARSELIINRGQQDGLAKGQFVLGDNSIIGIVSEISPTRAKVRLVTDTSSRIPVTLFRRNGDKLTLVAEGVLHGAGDDSARVPLIPLKTTIQPGDLVYAKKQAGLLDVPIVAGKVFQCRKDIHNPLVWDITVRPLCTFERLTEIAIVVMKQ